MNFFSFTSQEFSSILLELKKVEKQLQGINRTSSVNTSELMTSCPMNEILSPRK